MPRASVLIRTTRAAHCSRSDGRPRGVRAATHQRHMDVGTDLWLGTLKGISVVYDPGIQVQGSPWVLLVALPHKRLIPYQKAHARSVAKPLADHEDRLAASEAYVAWRRTAPKSALDDAADDVRRKNAFLAKKLQDITAMHRRRLESSSLFYRGVTEPDGRGPIRNASCRECHRAIGSDKHLICSSCGWIVCSSCGTCGC